MPAAVTYLEQYRGQAKNAEAVEELIAYLRARADWIPNYRARRREQQYIGSGHVEKANDLLVARRQKGPGMQWSQATSEGLAALRTLVLNGGWVPLTFVTRVLGRSAGRMGQGPTPAGRATSTRQPPALPPRPRCWRRDQGRGGGRRSRPAAARQASHKCAGDPGWSRRLHVAGTHDRIDEPPDQRVGDGV